MLLGGKNASSFLWSKFWIKSGSGAEMGFSMNFLRAAIQKDNVSRVSIFPMKARTALSPAGCVYISRCKSSPSEIAITLSVKSSVKAFRRQLAPTCGGISQLFSAFRHQNAARLRPSPLISSPCSLQNLSYAAFVGQSIFGDFFSASKHKNAASLQSSPQISLPCPSQNLSYAAFVGQSIFTTSVSVVDPM